VAVEIGSDFLDPDDVPDVDSILWWCSSLVTQDKATGELSLSHFTVEEFLSDSKILDSESLRCFHMDVNDDLPLSAPQPRKPHSILAKVCLTYLHFEEFSSLGLKPWKQLKKDLDDNEFLKYCGEFWPKHAECREFDEELFDLMCRLFDPVKSRTFMLWLQIYWYGLDDDYERSVPKAASTLHLAACLRFTKICEWLVVEKNVDVNFHDAVLGTPIICAMTTLTYRDVSPSVPILRLLLKHGAKADVVLIEGRDRSEKREAKNGMVLISPMSLALDCADRQPKECSNVFRELLNSNQISPLTDSFFWSPPPPIIQPPHGTEPPPGTQPENNTFETMITLFKYILNHPSATSMDEESRTKMLSYIAKHTKEISDKEIVIRYTREELFSSQMATQDLAMSAAQNGQTQLIKTLIEKGSDPKALSDCLSLAARHGAADMVDILLNYCPWDVPYILSKIQTAWINAAIFGKVEVLKTFQKYGIDPKVVVRSDILPSKDALREGTALTYAILNGMIEAVKFLAAIPETDFGIRAEGRNLLHFTAQAPHHRPEMVALMLSKGLDPLDRSSSGGSILHYLLGNRYELGSEDLKIIQSILGAGGDIYAVDHHETSLLHVLFERTDLQSIPILNDFVNIIIGDSRMISKPRKDGVLPLQLAIRSRQPSSIIQMLLPKDLSLWNSPEDRKFGPIHEAVKVVTTSRQTSRRPPPPLGRLGLVPIIDDELHVLRILDILLEVPGVITNVSDENGNTPLLTIAGSIGQYAPLPSPERAQIIKKLLENGCDVNHRNDKGWTAVHFLANVAYVDGLREILKFSPDLSYQNADGDTALHLAVFLHRHGEKESDRIALRKLLDYAASKDQKSSLQLMNKRGYLPLHLACQNQYEGLFQMFHDSGNIPNINVRTKNEETPLILAAMQDHTRPIIRTLLRLGAEINSQDFAKQTALHHAAAQGLIDSVKMLAEHGASCTITDENGYQPWVLAAVDDYDETAEWLKHRAEDEIASSVEPGSAPKMPEIRDGELDQEASNKANHNSGPETSDSPNTKIGGSAMLKAIDDGKESLVQALLKMGSNPNEHLGRAQRTPLHIASALGSSVIVRSLIKHGANIEGKDKYGNTPLHLAASDGRDANIRILVKAGAKLDARDNLMKTPLHWTAIEGELYAAKAIMELAEKGEVAPVSPASNSSFASRSNTDNFKGGYFGQAPEDPNQDTDGDSNDKSSTGEPPQGRHPSLPVNEVDFRTAGSYLLEMRNSDRETPLLSALCSDRLDVAKYLVEKGANVHFQDRAGCNALWHAVFLADKELIETFLSRGVRVESATYSGFSPLHVAIDRGFAKQEETTEIARILIKAGANLSSNNRGKVSPLHCACHIGNLTIAKELLALSSEGEDRVESAFYGTPVYAASFRGHLEVVKLLLERGVDVNAGMRGESPLEAAILEGHEEVAALLEEHGAVRTKEVGGSGSIGREDPDPSERRRNVERYLIHTASALSIDVPE
jgi:ankyrin repeat protein